MKVHPFVTINVAAFAFIAAGAVGVLNEHPVQDSENAPVAVLAVGAAVGDAGSAEPEGWIWE